MRLASPNEPLVTDHTGEIISFSAIGPGPVTGTDLPRPLYCYTSDAGGVVWQTPNGANSVTLDTTAGVVATGSEFIFTSTPGGVAIALICGPNYFSPDGEHCCVMVAGGPAERRCLTFSEC